MDGQPVSRPQPEPDECSRPYWDGLREHRLRLQRCSVCGAVRHYPRPLCAHCHAFEHDWLEAKGRGRVHSWTVCHHAFHPAFRGDVPYVMLTVDLEEGVRVQAPLRGAAAEAATGQIRIGTAVRIVFEDVSADLTLPAFRLADSAPGDD